MTYIELSPDKRIIDPVVYRPGMNFYCSDLPYYWPYWVGGDGDFFEVQGRNMSRLDELRLTTMLEE